MFALCVRCPIESVSVKMDTSLDDVYGDDDRDFEECDPDTVRCMRWCGMSRCKDDDGRVDCERG